MKSKLKANKPLLILGGIGAGLINGLLGSGGGMIAVPALEKAGLPAEKAHSGSVAVILPLSVLSALMYIRGGHVSLGNAFIYIPGGIIGAFIGAWLLKRISAPALHKVFGAVALFAGVRLLLR